MLDLHMKAQQFYQATYGQLGMNDVAVLEILKEVAHEKRQEAFNGAVRDVFAKHGKPAQGALDVIDHELEGNGLTRLFCRSRLKRAMDVYYHGKDQYQGTNWEYRREGFWNMPRHILSTIKKYPLASGMTVASLLTLGYLVPVLSAMAGGVILTCTLGAVLYHEYQASRYQGKNDAQSQAERSRHLQESGENACSFLMTLPGVTGIWKTLNSAVRAATNGFEATQGTTLVRVATAAKNGIFTDSHLKSLAPAAVTAHTSTPTKLEVAAVLFGLLDEVLVPFSKLADLLHQKPQVH